MPGNDDAPAWYPWYWEAFYKSTRGWPFEAKAVYRELLDIQWQEGSVPSSQERCRLVTGCSAELWRIAWPFVEEKFPLNGNKSWRQNWVLAAERDKSVKLVSQKRAFGSLGGTAKKINRMASSGVAGAVAGAKPLLYTSTSTVTDTATDTVPEQESLSLGSNLSARPAGAVAGDAEFAKLQSIYPKRHGNQRWAEARGFCNARIKNGYTWATILEAAQRYADAVRRDGKEHTDKVMQAASFVGKNHAENFSNPWSAEPNKSQRLVDRNIAASQTWLARKQREREG